MDVDNPNDNDPNRWKVYSIISFLMIIAASGIFAISAYLSLYTFEILNFRDNLNFNIKPEDQIFLLSSEKIILGFFGVLGFFFLYFSFNNNAGFIFESFTKLLLLLEVFYAVNYLLEIFNQIFPEYFTLWDIKIPEDKITRYAIIIIFIWITVKNHLLNNIMITILAIYEIHRISLNTIPIGGLLLFSVFFLLFCINVLGIALKGAADYMASPIFQDNNDFLNFSFKLSLIGNDLEGIWPEIYLSDLLLPGFFIAWFLRYDMISNKCLCIPTGYFVASLFSVLLALIFCFSVSYRMGQRWTGYYWQLTLIAITVGIPILASIYFGEIDKILFYQENLDVDRKFMELVEFYKNPKEDEEIPKEIEPEPEVYEGGWLF